MSDRTVRNGITEIRAGEVLPAGHQWQASGGREPLEDLIAAVEQRGDVRSSALMVLAC